MLSRRVKKRFSISGVNGIFPQAPTACSWEAWSNKRITQLETLVGCWKPTGGLLSGWRACVLLDNGCQLEHLTPLRRVRCLGVYLEREANITFGRFLSSWFIFMKWTAWTNGVIWAFRSPPCWHFWTISVISGWLCLWFFWFSGYRNTCITHEWCIYWRL
jgi:hypothetical protein